MEEELQDRLDSRRSSVKDLRRQKKDELILSVANLEQNFDKVKSYEAEALEQTNKLKIFISYTDNNYKFPGGKSPETSRY